jgi:hypothetical protein
VIPSSCADFGQNQQTIVNASSRIFNKVFGYTVAFEPISLGPYEIAVMREMINASKSDTRKDLHGNQNKNVNRTTIQLTPLIVSHGKSNSLEILRNCTANLRIIPLLWFVTDHDISESDK